MDNAVVFKGTRDGFTIILNKDIDFNEIKKSLESKVNSLKNFLKGSKIFINFKGRKLSDEEIQELLNIITSTGNIEVLMVSEDEEPSIMAKKAEKTDENEVSTKLHKGTLRSGQSINYPGNVVLIGDVNPGAEIVAEGNIIVLGIVRGMVHAGAAGNNNAFVIALNLQPTQLRIGDVITRPPDNESVKGINPEIAAIKDNMIYIERISLEK